MIKITALILVLLTVFWGGVWASKQYTHYTNLADKNAELVETNQQLIDANKSYIDTEQALRDKYQKELAHVRAREARNVELRKQLNEAQKANLANCRIPTDLLRIK